MTAAEYLTRVEAAASAATEGPWTWDGRRVPTLSGRAGDPEFYAYDVEVIEADHGGECGCRSAYTLDLNIKPEDAAFIALSRDAMPRMAAALRAVLDVTAGWHEEPTPGHGAVDDPADCWMCRQYLDAITAALGGAS